MIWHICLTTLLGAKHNQESLMPSNTQSGTDTVPKLADNVVSTENPKPISNRPDGTDENRYKGWQSWSYKRWAWEFLRRNPSFISACEQLAESSSSQDAENICKRFGLKKYKSYRESYKGKSGIPKFDIGRISSWSNIENDPNSKRSPNLKISSGEVVIRFDVAAALHDSRILDREIERAKTRLHRRLKQFQAANGLTLPNKRHRVSMFLAFIRILDASAAGKTQAECELSNSLKLD